MNNFELVQKYLPLLDEVYVQNSKTAILDGTADDVKPVGAHECKIRKIDVDGLGDFDRNSGYTGGNVSSTWETVKYDKERSKKITVDRLDNEEGLGGEFLKTADVFLKTQVIPETDAARFAHIAGTDGISKKAETLASAQDWINAISEATVKMDDEFVPETGRILWLTNAAYMAIKNMDAYKSQAVLDRFDEVITVSPKGFFTAIDLKPGGEGTYGYAKAEGAKNINFLIVQKDAVKTAMDQYVKYFTPDQDQNGDNHIFAYRNNNIYGYVMENKLAGVYCSYAE
jgi:hypothetical protein